MYLSSIGSVPLLLFLLSALHEIRNPCRQSEVVRIISGLLLLLFATGLGPGLALRPGAPEAALAAVDAVVAGRQLWRTVSGAGPDTVACCGCHASPPFSPVPGVAVARGARGAAARHAVRVLVAAPGPGHSAQVSPVIQQTTATSRN